MVKLTWDYKGMKSEHHLDSLDFVIGRAEGAQVPDVQLDLDPFVAVRHARVWKDGERWWVEDLGSTTGTLVDCMRILGPQRVEAGCIVKLGSSNVSWREVAHETTVIEAELPASPPAPAPEWLRSAARREAAAAPPTAPPAAAPARVVVERSQVAIASMLDGRQRSPVYFDVTRPDAQARLTQLMELPSLLAGLTDLTVLCRHVLERVLALIPGAERGAFLVLDPATQKLALRASHPPDQQSLSRTLVRRAASDGCGFIWNEGDGKQAPTESMRRLAIRSGMYAPLMWQDEVVGVLCVDNATRPQVFTDEDLRFLMAVAQFAAAAIANHQMRASLSNYSTTLERLLTNFSPKLRNKLVAKAGAGGLAPGGERSDVTLLMSDLRGFTRVCADLPVEEVVAMLNEYFSAYVQILFDHGGTVDKFIGDAILAVFGSPEPDPDQHRHAAQAALAMQAATQAINQRRRAAQLAVCEVGIGLHRGPVMHGFIGAAERLEFTVIGDAVNVTTRVCEGAGPQETLATEALRTHLTGGPFQARERWISVKHAAPMQVWEIKPGPTGK